MNRTITNTVSLIFARVMQPLISLFLIVLVARLLTTEEFGAYSFAIVYIITYQYIGYLSFITPITREVSKNRENASQYFTNAGLVSIGFGVLLQIISIIVLQIIQIESNLYNLVFLASFSLPVSAIIGVMEGIITGLERIYLISINQLIENILRALISIYLIMNGYGIIELLVVFVASRYLALVLYLIFMMRLIPDLSWSLEKKFITSFINKLGTFVLIIIFVTIYWRLDTVMLTKMDGEVSTAIYNAAYRLFQMFIIVPQTFVYSIFPKISKRFTESNHSFKEIVESGIRYLLLFSIPATVILFLLAEPVILLLYGEKYIQSVQVLQILMLTTIPYSITVILAYTLVASNLQKFDLIVNASSVAINVTLNYFLITSYGFIGASLATFLSICFYLLFQYPIIRKKIFKLRILFFTIKPIIASLIVGTLLLFSGSLHVVLNMVLALLVYLFLLYKFSFFNDEEKKYIIQFGLFFRRRRTI